MIEGLVILSAWAYIVGGLGFWFSLPDSMPRDSQIVGAIIWPILLPAMLLREALPRWENLEVKIDDATRRHPNPHEAQNESGTV